MARLQLADGLGAAEVHAHTLASDGMVTAEQLVRDAAAIGLQVLCITDHDTISDLGPAIELGHELGVDVVAGEEITARFPPGEHIVGLFLERQVRMHMSVEDTIDAIHDNGGLAIVAHPFMPTWFASTTAKRLRAVLQTHRVDGIEVRHTAPVAPWAWKQMDEFYASNRGALGAALGAGDSHFGRHDLGRVVTVFPGSTAADLRGAIRDGTTSPLTKAVPTTPPPLTLRLQQQRRSMIWLSGERRAGRVGGGAGVAP
ncbi:MAG: PHP domain-containing protein [Candidatus Dormibacteria bacterium]